MRTHTLFSRYLAAALALFVLACASDQSPVGAAPAVASVVIEPAATSLQEGTDALLRAVPRSASGAPLQGRAAMWSSNATHIATVDATGRVQALSPGLARLTATVEGKEGIATVTVVPAPVVSVELSVANLALGWNEAATVAATPRDAAGRPLSGRTVTWTSGNESVAIVSNAGRVEARGEGATTITASVEGTNAALAVQVGPAPVARVVFAVDTVAFETGEGRPVEMWLEDPLGRIITGRLVTWHSTDETTVRVVSPGMIQGVGEGAAVVTAASEGVSGSVTVLITNPPSEDLIYDRALVNGGSEIFTLSLLPGATPRKLNAGDVSRLPSPDPTGTRFAFAVTQPHNGGVMNDLYLVNVNGLGIKHFTQMPDIETDPAWSPDGQRIAFAGTNALTGRFDIWVIGVDGTGLVNLTAAMGADYTEVQPAWSRDGQYLAFAAMHVYGVEPKIWIIRADGTGLRQLSTGAGYDLRPTWSPAGDRIAFERSGGSATGADIMVIAPAGGTPIRLALPGNQYQPSWSADGRYLAYAHADPTTQGRPEIYTMRPDGTGARQRTWQGGVNGSTNPKWIKRQP